MKAGKLIIGTMVGSLLLSTAASYADVVYLEKFDNPGGDAAISTVGWFCNKTAVGTAYDGSSYSSGLIASSGDFMFCRDHGVGTLANQPILGWTDEVVFGGIGIVTNVSFSLQNESTTENIKLALKVDGSWYTSQSVFNNAVSQQMSVFNIDVHSIAWNGLDFVSGSSLVEGGAVTLPVSGALQAVGIFDASVTPGIFGSYSIRVDNFMVEAIPEPATLGLMGVVSAGLLLFRRLAI